MDERTKKRAAPVSFRLPRGLQEEFRARVERSGLSVNAFLTAAVFGKAPSRSARVSPLDGKTAVLLLAQAARISDRLDAGPSAGADHALAVQACHAELAEIRTCLMQILGRQP